MGQELKMFCFDLKHRISQKYQQRWIYFSVSSMQEILQTLQVVQSPSSSLLLSSLMIWPNTDCCIAAMDLTAGLPDDFIHWLFPLLLAPLSSQIFRPYFVVTGLVSRSLRHLRFLGKLFSEVSAKFPCDSTSDSYCKKDYSKSKEVK